MHPQLWGTRVPQQELAADILQPSRPMQLPGAFSYVCSLASHLFTCAQPGYSARSCPRRASKFELEPSSGASLKVDPGRGQRPCAAQMHAVSRFARRKQAAPVRRVGAPENVRWMLPQGTPPSLERATYHSKARAALLLGLARPAALLRTGPGCALRHTAPLKAPSWCSTAAGSAWASLSWACARASPPPPSGRPAATARRARAPSCAATAGPRCRPVRPSQALRFPKAHS